MKASAPDPVPPPGPPPGAGRRPCPAGVRRTEVTDAAGGGDGPAVDGRFTMEDIRKLVREHSANVVSEVRRLIPAMAGLAGQSYDASALDMGVLTQALADRDREVQALEARLAELQADLASKDRRVVDLGNELDAAVREVRHRQLDLEFQQLKLEERVRSNAELEQAQRNLSARVEEASLNARHAALEADMCRTTTPRGFRAQGSLPWMLRKNRLPAVGMGDMH